MKIAYLRNRWIPNNINTQKHKKAQNELTNVYLKEQIEYTQIQINKIRDSVEDRQSNIAWQMVNKVTQRKSFTRAKLKAGSQEERIHLWKQYFDNLLRNPPKVKHGAITKIIDNQPDIKLGQFTREELDSIVRQIKNMISYMIKYFSPTASPKKPSQP